ncbi:hypothetical protein [Paraburkholderia sp. Ac-20347]|uniref:hypothetical protein n=1 Tax=Paraburkholderia sp. Ac-20347 TaxID=2703892 RepID=UPI001980DBE8|nr:hypothetical protein [Paraburkholderia sp. Ac-20347]MBN3809398.1 hypothetical protein [Paraburkholderia sp. Ac-20347]
MKLYRTSSVCASIRKAHSSFTHIHVHRMYVNAHPILVKTNDLKDLPLYSWAEWLKEAGGQLARWREHGGVLLNRGRAVRTEIAADAMVFFECPLSVAWLESAIVGVRDQVIVPVPHTWAQHELTIDLQTPAEMELRALWVHCAGRRLTDHELADESGLPQQHVMRMRRSFKAGEEWDLRARLAPEEPGLLPAWGWVGGGRIATKREVRASGHKTALREMARRGHIALSKYHLYPEQEPDWNALMKKRAQAIEDLDRIRSLVESLPDHLQGE